MRPARTDDPPHRQQRNFSAYASQRFTPVRTKPSPSHIRQSSSPCLLCTSANCSRGVGSRRTRGFDCLTEPGLVCLPIAVRPKQSPVLKGAMGKLYEAGEGVSKPCVRREPTTRPPRAPAVFKTPYGTPRPQPVSPLEPAPRSQDLRPKIPSIPSAHAAAFPDRCSG